MTHHYRRNSAIANRRKSTAFPIVIREDGEDGEENVNGRRSSTAISVQRRYSTISQLYLPHGLDYHPQSYVPPSGPEGPQTMILSNIEYDQSIKTERGVSIVSHIYEEEDVIQPTEEEEEEGEEKLSKRKVKMLFFLEPILSGLIIFPILVLFWECGWNLVLILLNRLNQFRNNLYLDEMSQEDFDSYTWESLVSPYLIVQFLLLIYYLCQNLIYQFLSNQNWIIQCILLKLYIFVLATIYVFQWEMLWTIWDQFSPHEWYFELTLSIASIFALIVFIGHISDLVCSPFIYSYDSIESCVHFGCPLLTKDMKGWKINLINYVLYEIVISNLSVIAWRGIYHYLDNHLYPNHSNMSAGICLIIGYVLYFPLMYFQRYLEELNLKYEFWTFVSINFPQFYRNIRHVLAFLSCVFAWRGYWLLYDSYIYISEDYYKAYLLFYILSFFVLCLIQTSSSTTGPLSHIVDPNGFFPLYPHCYISMVQEKISQLPIFCREPKQEDTKL